MQPFCVPFSSCHLLLNYKFADENVLHVKTSTFQLCTFYPISPLSLESNCVIILYGRAKYAVFIYASSEWLIDAELLLLFRQAQAALRGNKFKTMMKFHLPGLVTSSGDVILEPVMKRPPRKWTKVVLLVKSVVALKYRTFITKSPKNKNKK